MGDQQGDLKRTLSGIASAAIVLGAISPMAFAATSTSGLTPAGQLPIVVNGQVLSNPYEMVGIDSGNKTGYFPIYYFSQALAKIGIQSTWNGVTHTWALTDSNVNAANVQVAGGVGTGNTTVTLNGTAIKMFNTQAAKDPAGGPVTTYMPIYYIDNILTALGIHGSFSGQTGLNITTAQNTAGSSLSAITVSGGTGTGSASNPAVALNNQTLTLSTTLTDANGNPVPNTAVQFEFSEYGNAPSVLPTVMNSSGTVISGTSNSSYEAYTVYTDNNGVATIKVQGPAGQTYAYEVVATAPYAGSNNTAITSQPAYVTFVGNDEAAITPYAGQNQPFGATMGTAVPITVVVPPNSAGQPQSNVLVTLTTTGGAYFTNSSGADLGQTIQVTTNSSGIAEAWLNDSNNETVEVSAQMPTGLGINNPSPTYIYFAPASTAANIANYSISSTSVQAGQYVTVSGQLVNAAGNPLPNAQVLVVGNDLTNSGDFGYATTSNGKTTLVDFPDVGNVSGSGSSSYVPVAKGTAANSSTGLLITADSNGNFSFQVTDTSDNSTATFSIYPVSNGVVTSSTPLKSGTITFATSTTLDYISVAGTDSAAQANTYTSISGLSAANHSDAGAVFVDPQNAAGDPLMGQNLTYTLTVNNGGTVAAITDASGKTILPINASNPGLASVTVEETYNASTNTYTITVPGQSGSITQTGNPDFGVVVYNGNTGATTLTIQSGGVTATAQYTFTGGQPTYVQNLSPISATMTPGAQQTVTLTVEDDQGNPVSNSEVPIYLAQNGSSPLAWITQVNGVALDQTENMGTTSQASYASEPTPIPVGGPQSGLGYSTVNISGVVAWNSAMPNMLDVYTNSNGQVSLTLSNGTTYYVAPSSNGTTPGTLASAPASTSGSLSFWTWPAKGDSAAAQEALVIESGTAQPTSPTNTVSGTTYQPTQELGSISFSSSATTSVPTGSGTVTIAGSANDISGGTLTVSTSNVNITGGSYQVVNSSGTVVSGVTSTTPSGSNNQATLSIPSGLTPGTYTVQYVLNGAVEASGTFTVAVGSAAKATVNLSQTSVTAGNPVIVYGTVTDANGNPVSNVTVYLSGAGIKSGSNNYVSTTTSSTGAYAVSVTPTMAGNNETITVSSDAAGQNVLGTATLTVNPASASQLTVSPTTATVTNGKSQTVTATVTDAYGNPVSGVTVNFALESGAAGTLSAASATTNASGQASVTYTAPSSGSGTDTVTATVSSVTSSNNTCTITY